MTVKLIRKPIRNMYLRVQPPNGDIRVMAPTRISTEVIETFVSTRKTWIRAQQRKIQRMQRDTMRLVGGATGEEHPESQSQHLNDQAGRQPSVSEQDSSGIGSRDTGNRNIGSRDSVTVWTADVQRRARQSLEWQLPALLDHWTRVIGRSPTRITFRIMRSRWGSCTPATGRIRLNLQLGLMEPRFLEYVLVHEMVHLFEPSHNHRFKALMGKFLPDWRERQLRLNNRAL